MTAQFENVLVTGGNGFVGRRLIASLRQQPGIGTIHSTRRADEGDVALPNAIPFELNSRDSVRAAIEKLQPNLVVHLAAQASVAQSASASFATWNTNLVGTMHLAEGVTEFAPNATVLFVSSAEVYGLAFKDGAVDENTLPNPQSIYARSKLAAELLLSDVLPVTSKLIIARPSNHSGPGQDNRFVIPSFANQIKSGFPEILVGNLSAKRDFMHVDDVVAAYVALIANSSTLDARSRFNVSSGQSVEVAEILRRLIELSGRAVSSKVDPDKIRPVDIPEAIVNSELIRKSLGWNPKHSLDDILLDVLEN